MDFEKLIAQVEKLSPQEQERLQRILEDRLSNGASSEEDSDELTAGWAKELITIGEDFDEPLNDFKEYRE